MKTIVTINLGNFGSTGKIIDGISKSLNDQEMQIVKAYPGNRNNVVSNPEDIIICSELWRKINERVAMYTGYIGSFSFISTLKFLIKLSKINPTIIHIHNLHNSYLNHWLLFGYLSRKKIKIIWTLHDCWSFTGQCPHFMMNNCEQWKYGCNHCKQNISYPLTKTNKTRQLWRLKSKYFTRPDNMVIVTPSKWLASLVRQSYFGTKYRVITIHNGIDIDIFQPRSSSFRTDNNCDGKFIILGVSFGWNEKKGLDTFIELASRIDTNFQIVLVGTDNEVDKILPPNIISIHKTHNQIELAEIYSAANVFVNPTMEENYPTVNMESIACGTPVITYDTGGSSEMIDETCGISIERGNREAMFNAIIKEFYCPSFSRENCRKKAMTYRDADRFKEYIELYVD